MSTGELRATFLLSSLSDDQLVALADAGDVVAFAPGEYLFRQGEAADFWWILLEGEVELLRRAGREENVMSVMTTPGVWAGGFRAWSDDGHYLTTGHALTAGRFFRVPAAALRGLFAEWFPLARHIIEGLFHTVRNMEARSREREAMVALGTLAAGLAHEINNPAAASVRGLADLRAALEQVLEALSGLARADMSAAGYVTLDDARRALPGPAVGGDPLALADREDDLLTWLEGHDVADAWKLAPPLAEGGADVAWCDGLVDAVAELRADALDPALRFVASTLSAATLLEEIADATKRISELVGAVKSYSQVDRATTQRVDITEGLDSTVVMLGHKLRQGVDVVRDYDPAVPALEVRPGELNQVWTNLIDNAIDAMDGRGTLTLRTRLAGDEVVVEVVDTGPGMPPDVQAHAFEPFFTTKDVGKGTGLGLDICRRIVVERHGGEIEIEASAAGTTIRVRLPGAGSDA